MGRVRRYSGGDAVLCSCSRGSCNTGRRAAGTAAATEAFTLIELLVVMAIILVLAGLILSISGYVQNKGARSRAEAEIAAMSAAIESYRADNGTYPRGQSTATPVSGSPQYARADTGTDDLNAKNDGGSTGKTYCNASRYLYEQLSGDANLDLVTDAGARTYFSFKSAMLALVRNTQGNEVGLGHIKDPFGNSYGYSTANQKDPVTGYNPTFDLWSTVGQTAPTPSATQWVKNW